MKNKKTLLMPFGKYFGKPISELPSRYVVYLLNENETIEGELLNALHERLKELQESEQSEPSESNRCQRELSELDQRITRLEEDLIDLREQLSATFEGGV